MRILFDNEIFDATLSADTVNANYPVTNLQNESVEKIYMSTTTTAVITATLSATGTVNCAYIGNTNATTATLALYDSSDTLLDTITLDTSRGGCSFTAVDSVSYVLLTLAGSDTIYLGAFGFGDNYTTPDPQNDVVSKPIDKSTRNISNGGQLYINRVGIRHQLDITYGYQAIDKYNEILALWEDLEHPVWVDVFEENTGMINPMWCDMTMDDSPERSGGLYTWTHTFEEIK